MTSALSPRDIQARIRSGESLEDVAREAGMPADKVEAFAAPVLAEREHVAGSALQQPVRRRGETGSVRPLRTVIAEKLAALGRDVDDIEWDAWRNEDRRWSVVGRWTSGDEQHEATFTYDQRARFSVAANDDARRLIGEYTAPAPSAAPSDSPDAEPTIDLNDELALVRAVQGSVPLVDEASDQQVPRPVPSPVVQQRQVPVERVVETERIVETERVIQVEPVERQTPAGDDERDVDDYSPAELEEVDGIYDIVPSTTSDMDVLYEMLSSFSEDSVNIYAGLTNPVTSGRDADPDDPSAPVEPLRSPEEYASEAPGDAASGSADDAVGPGSRDEQDPFVAARQTEEPEALAALAGADPEDVQQEPSQDGGQQVVQPGSEAEEAQPAHPEQSPTDQAQQAVQPGAEEPETTPQQATDALEPAPSSARPDIAAITAQYAARRAVERPEAAEGTVDRDPAAEPALTAVEDAEPALAAGPGDVTPMAGRQVDTASDGPVEVSQQADPGEEREVSVEVVPTDHVELVEPPAADVEQISEPEQDALVEAPEPAHDTSAPKSRARSSRKKRAQVPSWDEIMFGGPTPGKG